MKCKKRISIIIALIVAIAALFVTGCSEQDIQAASTLLELASNVMDTDISENASGSGQAELSAGEDSSGQELQSTQTLELSDQTTGSGLSEGEPATEIDPSEWEEDYTGEFPTLEEEYEPETAAPSMDAQIPEDGEYLSMEQVSAYLHIYGHLPDNYLTKSEAKDLGWVPSKGNLWDVAPGCAIGGDRFGNREKLLPSKKGRKYYECDVNYDGGERGAERIVFSNDGLIYYTDNHYEDFMLLFDGSE